MTTDLTLLAELQRQTALLRMIFETLDEHAAFERYMWKQAQEKNDTLTKRIDEKRTQQETREEEALKEWLACKLSR